MTKQTWKRICYSILSVPVPFLGALGLIGWFGLSDTTARVLFYSTIVVWLALVWIRPLVQHMTHPRH